MLFVRKRLLEISYRKNGHQRRRAQEFSAVGHDTIRLREEIRSVWKEELGRIPADYFRRDKFRRCEMVELASGSLTTR